ncbi:flagellar motor switch protein FliM [Alsobacter sp. SYSU M60028]|uniref:Flagellar motor switch protein FliM n=2 Tax=Alsobacter ponti TaxID=2962936 RepID=A0ABT1L7A1_9HYPH|nr:flagellar motor switch protein FliM [Alsobacter ponti]MCP8937330.1 flagellar motor switch protein FliM [Alsobacter ponti]
MIEAAAAPVVADAGIDRLLNQDEIDNLLGFANPEGGATNQTGLRAIVDSAMVSYERLPMLEIVFDRLVRLLTTTLRNFFSDNVEVSLSDITSVRFGDYINSIPLPTILAVFKAEEWDNFGLITVDTTLAYSVIDVLLGGRRSAAMARLDGRPYSTIETSLVRRLLEIVLQDTELAFKPLSAVHFAIDRIETNPRFASISRPANAAILIQLRIDMEGRGGAVDILLPYATIEPIREMLLQSFMGEKFGRDPIWEDHLATEIWQATASVDAILHETQLPLRQIMSLTVGDTLMFDMDPDSPVTLKCGDVELTDGRMGRAGDRIAIRVNRPLRRSKTTFAAYEASATVKKDGK